MTRPPPCGNMGCIMDNLLLQARNATRDPRDCRGTIDTLRGVDLTP